MDPASSKPEPSRVPDCLTVEEAARVLRIGRTAAYAQTRLWRETGGRAGIPYLAFGSSFRVPTAALEVMLGRPITHVPPAAKPRPDAVPGPGPARPQRRPGRRPAEAEVRQMHPRPVGTPESGQGSLPL
jgi:hypothetical protein